VAVVAVDAVVAVVVVAVDDCLSRVCRQSEQRAHYELWPSWRPAIVPNLFY
jgi:hypothetical protein